MDLAKTHEASRTELPNGELKVADAPAPRVGDGSLLVATRISLISSGTERQLIDLAKASLAGKAMARPDLVRRVMRNIQRTGCSRRSKKSSRSSIPHSARLQPRRRVWSGPARQRDRRRRPTRLRRRRTGDHAEINAIPKNLTVAIHPMSMTRTRAS